jgi:uncharacterized surface protein with fasciclin (FAS1) repeats
VTDLSTQGVTVSLPPGFEGRAIRRPRIVADPMPQSVPGPATAKAATDDTLTILHAATVALPAEIGDFGSNVVDVLGTDDVFVSVFEFDRRAANTALFATQGVPTTVPIKAYSPNVLQRWIRGQSGAQQFFSVSDRAFCLYVVLGSDAKRNALAPKVDALLKTLRIETTDATSPSTTPGTVVDVIKAQADLQRFNSLLARTDVATTLAATGPWTVFAPVDASLADIESNTTPLDAAALRHFVAQHAVSGQFDTTALVDGETLTSLADTELVVGRDGQAVTVNGSRVLRPDVTADNGVVHVIETHLELTR